MREKKLLSTVLSSPSLDLGDTRSSFSPWPSWLFQVSRLLSPGSESNLPVRSIATKRFSLSCGRNPQKSPKQQTPAALRGLTHTTGPSSTLLPEVQAHTLPILTYLHARNKVRTSLQNQLTFTSLYWWQRDDMKVKNSGETQNRPVKVAELTTYQTLTLTPNNTHTPHTHT